MLDYREDITDYTEQELSLRVFNEEYFYIERHNWQYLKALIDEQFIYTDDQLHELIVDLDDEEETE